MKVLFSCFIGALLFLASQVNIAAKLIDIDSDTLQAMQINQNALIIDIRTAKEWQQTGIIPKSEKMQFFDENGNYDSKAWLKKFHSLRKSPEQPVVLVCRSGNRSGTVGKYLTQELGMNNIYHLENGMKEWLQTGKATEIDCAKLSNCEPPQP